MSASTYIVLLIAPYADFKLVDVIQPHAELWQSFGWGTLVNFFYLPGAIIGSFTSDWLGPRKALGIFVACQGVVGCK